MRNREVVQVGITLAARHIIIGVLVERQIRASHWLAQEVKANPVVGIEQVCHQLVALALAHFVVNQPGRRIGKRGPEAYHLLIGLRVVNGDGCGIGANVSKGEACLGAEEIGLIWCGQPHTDALSAGPGWRG